ncbi:hypothetical protein SPRA44_330102 [Serratia proteamaculans]|nr:hypothetical protein SPRA44_330102 [Serratia proteamaculans]
MRVDFYRLSPIVVFLSNEGKLIAGSMGYGFADLGCRHADRQYRDHHFDHREV